MLLLSLRHSSDLLRNERYEPRNWLVRDENVVVCLFLGLCCKAAFIERAGLQGCFPFVRLIGSQLCPLRGSALERLAMMFDIQIIKPVREMVKRLLLGGLGGSVGILGVLFAVGLYIVETLTRPKRITNFIDLYTFTPFEMGLPAEEVSFAPRHGSYLVSGWYVPHPQATTTIIICPGYRGKRADVLGISTQLWKAGHNILAFEYYGHGTVVGKPVTLGYREINDFLGAVDYARQRAPETRLGALGYSMGAAVAVMATARTPEIEALVADSPFATHKSVVDYAVRRA